MTDLERMTLEAIINSEYQDSTRPERLVGHAVWAWDVTGRMTCEPSQKGGAISSCVKKGWVVADCLGNTSDDDVLELTKAGVDAALAAGIELDV
jgi:hypothetical protein